LYVAMDQYLLIPFLVGWTSIYQLFCGSLGTRVLTHPHVFCWLKKIDVLLGWSILPRGSGDLFGDLPKVQHLAVHGRPGWSRLHCDLRSGK
jgi:hypothetical protein